MLEPIMHKLATQRIVLASGSPRRKEILNNVGLKFEVVPSTFEENLNKRNYTHPYEYCMATATGKALEVATRLYDQQNPPDLVIGADTVVSMDNTIFEKPNDKEHATQILNRLSGRIHTVFTGVTLIMPNPDFQKVDGAGKFKMITFHEGTNVKFVTLNKEIIKAYIDKGESMDKAGGYGIQGVGGTLIESISGDYFNVMGFPLHRFSKTIYNLYTEKRS